MNKNNILKIVEEILEKGALKKISAHSKLLAEDIASLTSKQTIIDMIDHNIEDCKNNNLPDKQIFLENLKTEWDSIPENFQIKFLILLFLENKNYMKNIFTSTLFAAIYYKYKNS